MAVTCRLREYRAEVFETGYEIWTRRIGIFSGVLTASLVLFYTIPSIAVIRRQAEAVALEKAAFVRAAALAPKSEAVAFARKNWDFLEHSTSSVDERTPGVQDLDSPEWENRQAYKDLKAMAVYELKEPPRKGLDPERIVKILSEGGQL